ncbi:hypothetical protein DBR32_06025 [Taibaiella sp. KBW10]|uniref:DUF4270 family protein n=1 Tax=Taibaiella sp. KBW10 TaxID=2153357 RepID=UPI000F5A0594|nr:DUF4270 family protein [Taibaiella sp. KBW10]RQO31513.1 hypothetical protein DBR32_06025 [Taibaiella sp. KBW10]
MPEVDNINTFALGTGDFDISFYNRLSDSIITSKFFLTTGTTTNYAIGLGGYTDPFFGKTIASAYLQFTPYKSNFKFPANITMDSAVLVLPYAISTNGNKSYGDTTKSLNLKVYKTTNKVEVTQAYYSNSNIATETTPIGSASIPFSRYSKYSSAILATGDTTTGQLRLKLDNTFAQAFKNADTLNFINTSAFQEYLKGIYITPDPAQSMDLMSYFIIPTIASGDQKSLSAARIEFHYHTPDSVMMSSIIAKYEVCGFFSNYNRIYTGAPAAAYLNKNSDSVLIQSEPGFSTDITIDQLNKIPQAVINKAELVFTTVNLAGTLNSIFTPIDVVTPVLLQNNQELPLYEVLDNNGNANTGGSLFVNPYAQKKTIGGIEYTQYRINIPRTLQHIIAEGKTKITIRIRGSKNYPGMYRVLAPGITSGADTKFQFNIIYTKKQ